MVPILARQGTALLVLLMLVPLGSGARETPSAEAATGMPAAVQIADWEASARSAPVESRAAVPTPDSTTAYRSASMEAKLSAWRAWGQLAASMPSDGRFAASPWILDGAQGGSDALAPISTPRGLRDLWSVETHGRPRAVIPVSPPGATLLVTSVAVLRFEAPDQPPSWMVKFGGIPGAHDVADANGDGKLDLVLGLHSWFSDDIPSPLVIDGTTGNQIWAGPSGDDGLMTWSLADLDGDRKMDLFGRNNKDEMAGYSLSGTRLFVRPLPLAGPIGTEVAGEWIGLEDYWSFGTRFGDVSGDGVSDIIYLARKGVFPLMQTHVVAASGKDGSLLWDHVRPPSDNFFGGFLGPAGDMNGDGRTDLTLLEDAVSVTGLLELERLERQTRGIVAINGASGQQLFHDARTSVRGTGTVPVDQTLANHDYSWLAILDLDRDGKTELVGRRTTDKGVEFTGRRPGALPTDPSVEAYKIEAPIGDHDVGPLRFRDLDADGKLDILFITFSTLANATGHRVLHTHIVRVVAGTATEETTNAYLGLLDYDAAGKRYYGWILEDDRWTVMDQDGFFQEGGMRLVPSGRVLAARDVTDDGIQDLLLPKSLGVMWLDGTSGRLLHDQLLPEDRFGQRIVEEKGLLRALCEDLQDNYYLVDLETGKDEWSLAADRFGKETSIWPDGFEDVTGDGLSEVLMRVFSKDEARSAVLEPRKGETLMDEVDVSLDLLDALRDRPGYEIVRWTYGTEPKVSLHVPRESAPRWTIDAKGHWLRTPGGDLLVLWPGTEPKGRILDGATGQDLGLFEPGKDEDFRDVAATRLDHDGRYDLVFTVTTDAPGTGTLPLPAQARIWDGAKKEFTARYDLTPGVIERQGSMTRVEDEPWIIGAVGDWDGDGTNDLAFEERDIPVFRSGAKGTILAVSSRSADLDRSMDMDGDGREELMVRGISGDLHLLTYDTRAVGKPDSPLLRAVEKPLDPKVEEGAGEFFEAAKKGQGSPGPSLPLALLVLAAVALAAARFTSRRVK